MLVIKERKNLGLDFKVYITCEHRSLQTLRLLLLEHYVFTFINMNEAPMKLRPSLNKKGPSRQSWYSFQEMVLFSRDCRPTRIRHIFLYGKSTTVLLHRLENALTSTDLAVAAVDF